MEGLHFLVVALFVLAYGLVSGRLERTVVSGPMVFVAVGWLLGESALGVLEIDLDAEVVRAVIEITLVVVLFTDASRIDIGALRSEFRLPVRLLGAGMPLTIALGTVAAVLLFPAFSVWEALVLAVVLAPTDAALGQAVVSSAAVPARVRQTLNVESGLNDGIALPPLTIALALAGAATEVESAAFWFRFALQQVLLAAVVGVLIGYLGGKAVEVATRTGWMTPTFERLAALGISVAAFGVAAQVDGSGFIAAFVAGLTLGNAARPICGHLHQFAETEGQLLTLLVFLFFGAALVGPSVEEASWQVIAYAVLSLTVVRLIPVALSLLGAGLRPYTVGFMAWFGPRGLASIVFGLVVLEESGVRVDSEIFAVVVVTVLLSVFAHGMTAVPAARHYSHTMSGHLRADRESAEFEPAPEMPTRHRMT